MTDEVRVRSGGKQEARLGAPLEEEAGKVERDFKGPPSLGLHLTVRPK